MPSLNALGYFGLASLLALGAAAQTSPPSSPQTPLPPPPATGTPPPPVPAPDRTTATFGDWVLRCDRRPDGAPSQRFCELGQTIQRPGDAGPLAQIAVGRILATDPVRITLLLPSSVTFQPAPKLVAEGNEAQTIELTWLRCLPTGCFANAPLSDEAVRKLRGQKDGARLEYRDGPGREVGLALSFRGFGEAWEAFIRDSAN